MTTLTTGSSSGSTSPDNATTRTTSAQPRLATTRTSESVRTPAVVIPSLVVGSSSDAVMG